VYLAYRGYKAANIPFVPNVPLPEIVEELKQPLVVGLTIDPSRLLDIRKTRLIAMNQSTQTDYVNEELIQIELDDTRKLYRKNGWPVIDVTRRSVEETAALIIQYRNRQMEKRKASGQVGV
jgi:regulator of PEP synthase PpsR (kinase-PPPase family)